MKCTGGWLNCLQSHFWPVTKSNEPTFELHFIHFSFPFVHSDCSISSWIHCSSASSIKYTSVRPEILGQFFVASKSSEKCIECAFNNWADDIFEIIVLHLRHLICVSNFPSIFWLFSALQRWKLMWILSQKLKNECRPLPMHVKIKSFLSDCFQSILHKLEMCSPVVFIFTNVPSDEMCQIVYVGKTDSV